MEKWREREQVKELGTESNYVECNSVAVCPAALLSNQSTAVMTGLPRICIKCGRPVKLNIACIFQPWPAELKVWSSHDVDITCVNSSASYLLFQLAMMGSRLG